MKFEFGWIWVDRFELKVVEFQFSVATFLKLLFHSKHFQWRYSEKYFPYAMKKLPFTASTWQHKNHKIMFPLCHFRHLITNRFQLFGLRKLLQKSIEHGQRNHRHGQSDAKNVLSIYSQWFSLFCVALSFCSGLLCLLNEFHFPFFLLAGKMTITNDHRKGCENLLSDEIESRKFVKFYSCVKNFCARLKSNKREL